MEVETLLSRAADGVLPHDRIEALAMLSELLRDSDQVCQASMQLCVFQTQDCGHILARQLLAYHFKNSQEDAFG